MSKYPLTNTWPRIGVNHNKILSPFSLCFLLGVGGREGRGSAVLVPDTEPGKQCLKCCRKKLANFPLYVQCTYTCSNYTSAAKILTVYIKNILIYPFTINTNFNHYRCLKKEILCLIIVVKNVVIYLPHCAIACCFVCPVSWSFTIYLVIIL